MIVKNRIKKVIDAILPRNTRRRHLAKTLYSLATGNIKLRATSHCAYIQSVSPYYQFHFTARDIRRGKHREVIGYNWDEIGKVQFNFLLDRGLQPTHPLLDVGCGPLRGGIHFVRYLDVGNYYGVDLSANLIEAGKYELEKAEIFNREPHFLVTDKFELHRFAVQFDYALAHSVFTHLPMNQIVRCLVEMKKVLKPTGVFYASFFEAPSVAHIKEILHIPGNMITHMDSDMFHYSFHELEWLATNAGLKAEFVGAWNHPFPDVKMAAFTVAKTHSDLAFPNGRPAAMK